MLGVKNPKKFDWVNQPLQECMDGNALDTYYTLRLFEIFYEKLEEMGALKLYEHLMVPATQYFGFVEHRGLDIDIEAIDELEAEMESETKRIMETISSLPCVKPEDNLKAPTSLQDILYTREGGLELYPPDKTTKKAEPSTSADTIKILLTQINEVLLNE